MKTASFKVKQQELFPFNPTVYEEEVNAHCFKLVKQFKRTTRFHTLFHTFFSLLALSAAFAFLLFFSFFAQSLVLAFFIGSLFLMGFTYYVLRFYLQAKKPEQLVHIRDIFLEACKNSLPFDKGTPDFHFSISQALFRQVSYLDGLEKTYFKAPLASLKPLMSKMSSWAHRKDVFAMKELLILEAIKEHIDLVKSEPSDLEAHASLAKAYLSLSKIYRESDEKFRQACRRAIEEYKILDHYAPNDPWVHGQLASIYHSLGETEKEKEEYEHMLKHSPYDNSLLFRLGKLYFEQGENAKGLQIYEQLKSANDRKAETLIASYDANFN